MWPPGRGGAASPPVLVLCDRSPGVSDSWEASPLSAPQAEAPGSLLGSCLPKGDARLPGEKPAGLQGLGFPSPSFVFPEAPGTDVQHLFPCGLAPRFQRPAVNTDSPELRLPRGNGAWPPPSPASQPHTSITAPPSPSCPRWPLAPGEQEPVAFTLTVCSRPSPHVREVREGTPVKRWWSRRVPVGGPLKDTQNLAQARLPAAAPGNPGSSLSGDTPPLFPKFSPPGPPGPQAALEGAGVEVSSNAELSGNLAVRAPRSQRLTGRRKVLPTTPGHGGSEGPGWSIRGQERLQVTPRHELRRALVSLGHSMRQRHATQARPGEVKARPGSGL